MRALTNSTGGIANTYDYDAYGKQMASTGSTYNPFGYAGEYQDAESGLYYLRARYYDPQTQQFLTRDPIESLTQQPYAYAGGSPTNFVDPLGLRRLGEGATIWDNPVQLASGVWVWPAAEGSGPGAYASCLTCERVYLGGSPGSYTKCPYGAQDLGICGDLGLSSNDVEAFIPAHTVMGVTALAGAGACVAAYPKDFPGKNIRNWSSWANSEADARALAREVLGRNPVEIEPGKWRSTNGKWQYRAKPGDLLDKHIHLEELNPKTGEVLQNLHIRWK